MNTLSNIKADQLAARKAKNTNEATLLTTLLSESVIVGKNQGRESTDEEVIAVVKKFLKNNTQYLSDIGASNPELKAKLEEEKSILSRYVPAQMEQYQMELIVAEIITSNPTLNMGGIMKHMKANYDGQYDGKMLSSVVKAML